MQTEKTKNSTGSLPADPAKARKHDQVRDEYEGAIAAIEQNLDRSPDGKFHLKVSDARKLGIRQDVFDHLRWSLERTNEMIAKGEVKVEAVRRHGDMQLAPRQAAAVCNGRDLLLTYWWGTKVYVNECLTQAIEHALAIGAGAVAIAGLLSVIGAVPAAIVGGFLGIESEYIQLIDALGSGQGVIFNQPWVGPGWIWHQ